ncbi:MAG: hypothetical protein V4689_10375 [Verrucomicrobiota bacterium]
MNLLRSFLFFAVFSLVETAFGANDVVFADGNPGWRISDGKCTFLVPGRIVNQSSSNSISGTLRLCLWVTANPFPSSGYRVATYTLGQLKGGYQYSNFNPVTSVAIPNLTGNYHFTVSLEQYDGSSYITSDSAPSSVKTLKSGIFVTPKKWKAPAGNVISPRKTLKIGDNLNLTLQGSKSGGAIIYVPNGSQLKLRVKIEASGRTTVYGGSKPQGAPALYTYRKATASYAGKTLPVGSIALDYGHFHGVDSKSVYSMFYQAGNRGFYKGVDTDQGFSGTSWGIFTIN